MERAPQPVREMLALLRESGHTPYLVGGCVRDLLRGAEPDDYDMTSDAPLISPQYRRHKAGIQIAVAHAGNLHRILRLRHKSIRIICRALPRQPIPQ